MVHSPDGGSEPGGEVPYHEAIGRDLCDVEIAWHGIWHPAELGGNMLRHVRAVRYVMGGNVASAEPEETPEICMGIPDI